MGQFWDTNFSENLHTEWEIIVLKTFSSWIRRTFFPIAGLVHKGNRDEVVFSVRGGAEGRGQVRHMALLQAAKTFSLFY